MQISLILLTWVNHFLYARFLDDFVSSKNQVGYEFRLLNALLFENPITMDVLLAIF